MAQTIDHTREEVISLSRLGRLLPNDPSYKTIRSWVLVGRKNQKTGKKVFMEAKQMTWGLGSSVEAYNRFVEELNQGE